MDRWRPDPSSDLTPSLHQAEAVGRALLAGQEEAVDPAGQQECLAPSLPFLCLKCYQLEVGGTTLVLLHQTFFIYTNILSWFRSCRNFMAIMLYMHKCLKINF